MSWVLPEPDRRPGFLVGAGALLLATCLLPGCIRRYPAPTEQEKPRMPYSAMTTWRGIELPRPGGLPDTPLPKAAWRLALGPDPDAVLADGSLLPDGAALPVLEGKLDQALALLGTRSEPIVLLVDHSLWGQAAVPCSRLAPLSPRIHVAVGPSGHGEEPPPRRPGGGPGSRDPLVGVGLDRLCPAGATRQFRPGPWPSRP